MRGVVNIGDVLHIDPEILPTPGKIVVAKAAETGDFVVRFFEPLQPSDPRAPGFILRAENASYAEIVSTNTSPCRIVGVAVRRMEDI